MKQSLTAWFSVVKALVLAVVVICSIGFVTMRLAWPKTTIQRLESSDHKHRAKLIRMDGIDRIYYVRVDGREVYASPDFAPKRNIPFREALLWAADGRTVVLEIAGQRIFGYDVVSRRRLSDVDLIALNLPSKPELWEYGFESEWPGVGRVRQPVSASVITNRKSQ